MLPDGQNHKVKTISDREFIRVVKACDGNTKLAGRILDLNHRSVGRRILRTRELTALYGNRAEGGKINAPNELSTMNRTPEEIPSLIETSMRAEELMKQDRQMLRDGLSAAGIKPETIERLRALDGLAKDAGALLSASLDYTHRLHIYSQAALFEEMIYIRETYLRDKALDGMVQVFWQRAYNEIAELLGKGSDRTMASTQAMVAMMKAQAKDRPNGAKQNAKPGW